MLIVFDVNETLLDLSPLDDVFGSAENRQEWFGTLIRTALVITASDGYRDFGQIGAACARRLLGAGPGADDAIARLPRVMASLPAHPDVADALDALARRGHRLVALGNSNLAAVTAQLTNAGLIDRLAAVYSAEQAGALKPSPAPYRYVLDQEGVAADAALMVAAHDWDVAGARAVGLRTALLDRGNVRPLPGFENDQMVVRDIAAVAGEASSA